MTMDTRYIDCDEHGPRRRAYIMCKHLRGRADIAHHKPWSDQLDGAGEIICAIPGDRHTVNDLLLMCEDHLLDLGWLLPGETRLT
jgi:hypothetical protein